MKKQCLQCNKIFEKPYFKSKIDWIGRTKFCSKKCKHQAQLGFVPTEAFKKGHTPWNKGIPLTEEHKQKVRLARLFQVIPAKNTSIEIKIQNLLRENGIEFETHHPILGQPDIFIKPNIAIFCDGDYWHNLPKALKRDKEVNEGLSLQGYRVIRVWEHEINQDIESCYYKIKEVVG